MHSNVGFTHVFLFTLLLKFPLIVHPCLHAGYGETFTHISALEERVVGDEITEVIYSDCRPCLVVVLVAQQHNHAHLNFRSVHANHESSGAGNAGDNRNMEVGGLHRGVSNAHQRTIVLRFCDAEVALSWAVALEKCMFQEEYDRKTAPHGCSSKTKGIVKRKQSMWTNLACILLFDSSPAKARQPVDAQVA